jgi:hypothetical protein
MHHFLASYGQSPKVPYIIEAFSVLCKGLNDMSQAMSPTRQVKTYRFGTIFVTLPSSASFRLSVFQIAPSKLVKPTATTQRSRLAKPSVTTQRLAGCV